MFVVREDNSEKNLKEVKKYTITVKTLITLVRPADLVHKYDYFGIYSFFPLWIRSLWKQRTCFIFIIWHWKIPHNKLSGSNTQVLLIFYFWLKVKLVSSARDRSRQCRYTGSVSVVNRLKQPFLLVHITHKIFIAKIGTHKSKITERRILKNIVLYKNPIEKSWR